MSNHLTLSLRMSPDTSEKAHFVSVILYFCHYPKLVAINECRNIAWPVNWQLCLLAQLTLYHDITAEAVPNCLSIYYSILPPVLNKTPRYLNSSTWGSDPSPTQSRQFILFWLRAMASDFEVLMLKRHVNQDSQRPTPLRNLGWIIHLQDPALLPPPEFSYGVPAIQGWLKVMLLGLTKLPHVSFFFRNWQRHSGQKAEVMV